MEYGKSKLKKEYVYKRECALLVKNDRYPLKKKTRKTKGEIFVKHQNYAGTDIALTSCAQIFINVFVNRNDNIVCVYI